jgi:hypothetical protein
MDAPLDAPMAAPGVHDGCSCPRDARRVKRLTLAKARTMADMTGTYTPRMPRTLRTRICAALLAHAVVCARRSRTIYDLCARVLRLDGVLVVAA